MSLGGSAFLPPAGQLLRESHLVQEHIRKRKEKEDFERTVKAQLQQKHAQRRQKILVVANRLPTTAKYSESEGKWIFERASGGLVSCLGSIRDRFDMVWIGWPGTYIPPADEEFVTGEAMKQNCLPVFLDPELITDFYNGFANNVLWPLFHYIMPPFDKGVSTTSKALWEAYKTANEKFVDTILQVYEDDDYVWVHDYHLMLVPRIMRERSPHSNIGWFLHTPFPSAEIYRTLPWRQDIIDSLLHANLLAFHCYDYLRHFLSSCVQLTSLEISAHSVDATSIGGCIVTCATVPVGIAPEELTESLDSPAVRDQAQTLHDQYGGRKVILGVDRLDYMKGIPHKLMAFERFLDSHPEWASSCVLVQVAVPSRREVPEYQRLMRQVHEIVGQICGRHSKLETGVPVIYLDQSMAHNDLVALYQVADVALITSLRDGMNLVSYEYVACQKQKESPGVLILSEFTGAAQSLGAGAIRVNPWNLQETANAIHEALEMSVDERKALHNYAFRYINEHTAQRWAETFLQCLQESCSDLMEVTAEVPPLLPYEDLLQDWSESTCRLIIIDLLECLAPPAEKMSSRSARRRPRSRIAHIPVELEHCLEIIGTSPETTVVITADKNRRILEEVAGGLQSALLAAEGCCVCRPPGGEWRMLVDQESDLEGVEAWMQGVEEIFDDFRERTPGSYIEKEDYLIRWHWEATQFDFGSAQAREALIHLWAGPLANSEAEVVVGAREIAVRPHACSRSACLEKLLLTELGKPLLQRIDFALCFAVVPHRDEDVFEMLEKLLVEDADSEDDGLDPGYASLGGAASALSGPSASIDPDTSPTASPSASPPLAPLFTSSPPGIRFDSDSFSALLRTPPGPSPVVPEGESPPPYDWVPSAQREREARSAQDSGSLQPSDPPRGSGAEVSVPTLLELPPSAGAFGAEHRTDCICYTLSLGMKKTKAHYALPQPYHVQNLVRAMAARLPKVVEESVT